MGKKRLTGISRSAGFSSTGFLNETVTGMRWMGAGTADFVDITEYEDATGDDDDGDLRKVKPEE
jgi:hypothetical protein